MSEERETYVTTGEAGTWEDLLAVEPRPAPPPDAETVARGLLVQREQLLERQAILLEARAEQLAAALAPVQAEVAAIEASYADDLALLEQDLAANERATKLAVLAVGYSVESTGLQAVWNKARVSWDTKRLEDHAVTHPEILAFQSVGQPYISLCTRKAGAR